MGQTFGVKHLEHKSYLNSCVTMHKYYISVNAFKARTKRKIVENMKKAKDNNKGNANEGLTYDEIKQRDVERIKEKQRQFEEKKKHEG